MSDSIIGNKLTVSIDLDNVFHEDAGDYEERSLSSIVKDAIRSEVNLSICTIVSKSIKDEVNKQASEAITSISEGEARKVIEERISEQFETLQVKERYSSKTGTVSEFITDQLDKKINNSLHDKITALIENEVSESIEKLQEQYNAYFASALIKKMNDNEFLSHKAVTALFADKDNNSSGED